MTSTPVEYDKYQNDPPWMGEIDIDKLEHLAGIGYQPADIAKYFGIKEAEFMWYFNLISSPLKYHYERGQLLQEAEEGLTMSAAARKGDNVTQAQRFDKLRTKIGYRNSIAKIFFEDVR